jgi:NAD-dependent dihydropyrimidine dehydrogenase PreA subunit
MKNLEGKLLKTIYTSDIINMEEGKTIFINQDKCIKCGTCRIVCPFNAIKVS